MNEIIRFSIATSTILNSIAKYILKLLLTGSVMKQDYMIL